MMLEVGPMLQPTNMHPSTEGASVDVERPRTTRRGDISFTHASQTPVEKKASQRRSSRSVHAGGSCTSTSLQSTLDRDGPTPNSGSDVVEPRNYEAGLQSTTQDSGFVSYLHDMLLEKVV